MTSICGEDWTGFRGRIGMGNPVKQACSLPGPKDGPALVLQIKEAGAGLSGMAIVGDRLFTMGQRDDGQYTLCFSLKDGKQVLG